MSAADRFIEWFALYWALMLCWRVYGHWRGDRKTEVEWIAINLVEWAVFFALWLLVIR